MEPSELEDARGTLEQVERRLRRDIADMVGVLEADVPAFVGRSVRRTFEQAPEADRVDDAAVKRLKEDTTRLGQELAAEVARELAGFEVWTWEAGWTLPSEPPEDLDAHPRVSEVLSRVGAAVRELLERHGLPAPAEATHYRLPAYFVAGHFMKSLVANYWRALADHEALRRALAEADQREAREARAARWDRA